MTVAASSGLRVSSLSGPDRDREGVLPDDWWRDSDVLAHLEVWYDVGYELQQLRESEVDAVLAGRVELSPAWY